MTAESGQVRRRCFLAAEAILPRGFSALAATEAEQTLRPSRKVSAIAEYRELAGFNSTLKTLMKCTRIIGTAIVVICLAGTAFAKTATGSTDKSHSLSSADKAFIKEAAKGGMMEVAMGRQAAQNASNAEVKKFGNRMVTDHSKANDELKAIAAEEKVDLPAEKEPGKWKSDKEYMSMMVKDHEKDLTAFEKEAKEGSDPDLKHFADKTAAVVRKHLQMAKEIDGKLK